jgi:hypothetical protein
MQNPYSPPKASLDQAYSGENNSGGGADITPPDGVKGWSWGAFCLSWIWAVSNKTWIGLLCLVPYVGILMALYLGIRGRELAWRNKRWDSVEQFNQVQKRWSFWGVVIVVGATLLGIIGGIVVPAYQQYTLRTP